MHKVCLVSLLVMLLFGCATAPKTGFQGQASRYNSGPVPAQFALEARLVSPERYELDGETLSFGQFAEAITARSSDTVLVTDAKTMQDANCLAMLGITTGVKVFYATTDGERGNISWDNDAITTAKVMGSCSQ